jgi:hypothetical protein
VGIPFDTEDAMFSPPIVPPRPPMEQVRFWSVVDDDVLIDLIYLLGFDRFLSTLPPF